MAPDHTRPGGVAPAPDLAPAAPVHRVAVLAEDTVSPLELTIAVGLFGTAEHTDAVRYEVGVAGPTRSRTAVTTSTALPGAAGPAPVLVVPEHPLAWALEADTVVVPDHAAYLDVVPGETSILVKEAWHRGARVVGLGLGVFALAAAGVLDERAATTHWRWTDELARRHPRVRVRPDALFVDDGRLHTAAGAAGAVDLVLALIEHDYGTSAAATAADAIVAPPRREGGRAQHLRRETPPEQDPIGEVMAWAEEHLADDLGVADLARRAHLSPRHFSRRFRATVGGTPLDWLLRVRVRRAQHLLEHTGWPVERIAHECGFGSPGTFRHHFARVVGTTPGGHRRAHARRRAGCRAAREW